MKIWRLAKGRDVRFRQGHPWVFASELGHSAKEIKAGELIELHDFQDRFLAYGYGHPSSQICFRRLSSRVKDKNVLSVDYFVERLTAARRLRVQTGWAKKSHRWFYGDGDGTPGLIVDAFRVEDGWIAVVQASTAGIDLVVENVFSAIEKFKDEFQNLTVVEAPTSKTRALEGLWVGEKRVVRGMERDLKDCRIFLHHGLELNCDILHGQKTGFFLDQQWNAGLLRQFVKAQFAQHEKPVRILDICCYVGQWSGHVAHELKEMGIAAEVTLVDASKSALKIAAENMRNLGAEAHVVTGDAMVKVAELPAGQFDVVICDPPAFVKKKADLIQGFKAYAKLNRDAMRTVSAGGIYVASSCSGLIGVEGWEEILVQGSTMASRMFKCIAKGGHGPDHPIRPDFPEGEYLKCTIGRVEYPY